MTKTVLVAHRNAVIRERFCTALAQAGQRVVTAGSVDEVRQAVAGDAGEIVLALLDAGLAEPVFESRPAGARTLAAFASTVGSAAQARSLVAAGVGAWVNDHGATPQIVSSLAPWLFRDSFNRRAGPRVPVALAVSCEMGPTVCSATALNLGHGGLALRPLIAIPVGTSIAIRFHLPAAATEIRAEVRVCWTDARLGIGAQFEGIGEEAQRAVDAFVDCQLPAAERA
jgi:hypothetical protein